MGVLLECTTWSGIGPGLMDAVTLGGLEANGKASGILILMGEKEEREDVEGKVMKAEDSEASVLERISIRHVFVL